jgi:hypothetical protein
VIFPDYPWLRSCSVAVDRDISEAARPADTFLVAHAGQYGWGNDFVQQRRGDDEGFRGQVV